MLVIDGVKYKLWTPKDEEKEFHPMVKEHSKEIFGEDSVYFDIKHKLESKAGIVSIPDAYVISLSKPPQWFIVENELSSHPVFEHIVPQLSKFIQGIKNPYSQKQIVKVLHKEITGDPFLKLLVERNIASKETYLFISELISQPPKIAIVVEEMTDEIREACAQFSNVRYVEFKTFVREDDENVHAHLFEPLYIPSKIPEVEKKAREVKLPEHYESWEKMVAWVDENTRNITEWLANEIKNRFENSVEETRGRYLCFFKGNPSTKSIFAAFILTKKHLNVRIRTDPTTFVDPKSRVKEKIYSGWFFKTGQEREFKITSKEQIPYALELVKQSYELAK